MLLSCVAYQNGKKLAEIATGDIHAYIGQPDCFIWVALKDASGEELEQMRQQFDLHPLAVEDASHGHQRPKIEEYGDCVFAVLRMIEMDGAELREGEVDIFVGSNYVLSVRRDAEQGFAEVRARCEREPELLRHGPGYVLYALMDAVVDGYFPVIDLLESELDGIESRIFTGESARANIMELYALKQKLVTLKHTVAPLLEALSRLWGGRVPSACTHLEAYFRDVSDHLVRLNQAIDSVRDMVVTALSVNLSMITLQESETMKRLAAYAALVAVPTMIVGIYGMNFEHMPELTWKYGYPQVLGVMAIVDGLLFLRLRNTGWL